HLQTVSNENQRRFHLGCRDNASADECIVAEHQRLALTVVDEAEAAVLLDNLPRFKSYGLVEAVHACWFQASFLELLHDVFLSGAFAAAACIAAFHLVVGDNLDVIPPGVSVEVGGLRGGKGGEFDEEQEGEQAFHGGILSESGLG